MVFIVLFLSADFGVAGSSSLSPSIGSPTVPVSSYDRGSSSRSSQGYNYGHKQATRGRGLRRLSPSISPYRTGPSLGGLTPHRPDSYPAGPLGYSKNRLDTPNRYSGYDRYGQYLLPSGDLRSAYNSLLPNMDFLNDPLSGGVTDFKLTPFDEKSMDVEYRREKYRGVQSKRIKDLHQPVSSDTHDRVANLQKRGVKRRMEDEELLHDNQVYLNRDKSLSQQAKSDVNLSKESPVKKTLKDQINESLALPESLKVEKPLTMEEFQKRYAELKAEEKLEQIQKQKLEETDTAESNDLSEEIDQAKAFEDLKGKDLFGTKRKSDEAGDSKNDNFSKYKQFGKSAAKVEPFKTVDPMAGVTPDNIDMKLKRSRELFKKAENFDIHIKEKYLEYVNLADSYLARGQYRHAIVSYNIASAWNNNDPRAYAGNSFAHLAVSEYMSSSACLLQALELPGDFAEKKVDVSALIGNKKLYEKCLTGLKSKYKATKYYKTAFLLSYLYYQDGDILNAKECIDAAAAEMKQTQAWQSLSKAIEKALKKQKP